MADQQQHQPPHDASQLPYGSQVAREGVRAQEFTGSEPSIAERPPAPAGAANRLQGKRVAVILNDGFEQDEFGVPVRILREAGATVEVLAPDEAHLAHIKGERQSQPAEGTRADKLLSAVSADAYDGLLIPGGLASPDKMRGSEPHLAFVRAFMAANKPIAAICHAGWVLADADLLQGRTVTSWPNIRRDLERAGATWVDQQVQQDGNLITSRKPDDAEAFAHALVEQLLVASGTSH